MARLLSGWRRDLACGEAVALITDYLEGALPPRRRARLERHLSGCEACGEYLRQMRAVIGLLGRVEPGDLAPETRAGLVELFHRFREDEEGSGDGPGTGEGAP